MRNEIKQQRILEQAAKLLGRPLEVPLETAEEKMREAQSVLFYFESSGEGWISIPCKWCNCIFAYCYPVKTVAYCSVPCMDAALKAKGLSWNPNKLPNERWGRYIPAVVPPSALEALTEVLALVNHVPDTGPE